MTTLAWFIVIGLPLIGLHLLVLILLDGGWKTAIRYELITLGLLLGAVAFLSAFMWALYVLAN